MRHDKVEGNASRGLKWLWVAALGLAVCAGLAACASGALPLGVTPLTTPGAPALPAGYDWSLALDERHALEGTRVTEVSPEETALTQAYFAFCEKELGRFPLETFDCGDAQQMPVSGAVNLGASITRYTQFPSNLGDIAQCDRPSLIYRDLKNIGCNAGSRIRRVSTDATDWVYICRKAHNFFKDENLYSEIGLIGHNRSTGKTCFFAGRSAVTFDVAVKDPQGAGQRRSAVASLIGRAMHAPSGEAGVKHWSVPTRPGCTECHSHGPWINFPFVDGKNDYAEIAWGVDEFGDPKAEHLNVKGYTEADGKPVVPVRRPGMLYEPIYPHEALKLSAENYKWPKAKRLKAGVEGAGACTTCHHIGNLTYAKRYPRAVFYFKDVLRVDHKNDDQNRIDLYLANLTERLRGSHNTKMLTTAWSQLSAAQVAGFPLTTDDGKVITTIKEADVHRNNQYIRGAIEAIEKCAELDGECWDDHWTVARVKADPLRYLQETCSHCHNGTNKGLSRLVTKQEFEEGGNAWSRLSNRSTPHPPGGGLEDSVLTIIGNYLQH